MAETGSVTVKIGEERIKEMIKDSLADAWDAGWEAGVMDDVKFTESLKTSGAPLHDKTSNPFR